MAKKITELTDLPTPVDADILPIVDDVAGTPTTKKVTLANLLADAIRDGDLAGTYAGHLHRTGAGAYETIKSNLAATTAPTATDDTNSDYKVGSLWIDTTGDKVYICMDATATAAVWQEVGAGGGSGPASINLSPGGAIIPATGGATLTQVEGTNLPYYVLDFDADTDQSAYFQLAMPQSYDGGNFTIHFHSYASATTGAALMLVEGAVIEAGELVDQALSSLGTTTINPAATTNQLVVDVDNTNSLTGLAGGDLVIFKFTRDADDASDTMTGDLRVVGLQIEYTPA